MIAHLQGTWSDAGLAKECRHDHPVFPLIRHSRLDFLRHSRLDRESDFGADRIQLAASASYREPKLDENPGFRIPTGSSYEHQNPVAHGRDTISSYWVL